MTRAHVAVVGAGMVGVCCASYLQRAGYRVTVVDPRAPGEACSFGNAGVIAPGACLPMAMPGIWRQVPGFLLDPLGPLSIRWQDLPRSAPWLAAFLRGSTLARVRRVSAAMRSLHRPAFDCLEPLLREAGASGLLRRLGQLYVSSEKPAVLSALSLNLLEEAGVRTQALDAAGVRDLEPCIQGAIGGLLFPDNGHVTNPLRVVQALAAVVIRLAACLGTEVRLRGTRLPWCWCMDAAGWPDAGLWLLSSRAVQARCRPPPSRSARPLPRHGLAGA